MSRKKHGESGGESNGTPESKADKFRRLATRRVGKALKVISYLVPLANSRQYDYTPEQAETIVKALQERVDRVRKAFISNVPAEDEFTL